MRNKGKWQHRFTNNPMEKHFAEKWEEINDSVSGRGLLDYLLAKTVNEADGVVTERDRTVAATIVQWLGSPVGQGFIEDVNIG